MNDIQLLTILLGLLGILVLALLWLIGNVERRVSELEKVAEKLTGGEKK